MPPKTAPCAVCGISFALTQTGKVRKHNAMRSNKKVCSGSGKPPKQTTKKGR